MSTKNVEKNEKYVLVVVDGAPVLVKTSNQYPQLSAKYNYCHKFSTPVTCDIYGVYSSGESTEKVPVGHYRVKCNNLTLRDDLIELTTRDELELVKKDYESDYSGCKIYATYYEVSRLELEIIRFYQNRGFDIRSAMRLAKHVVSNVIDLTEEKEVKKNE